MKSQARILRMNTVAVSVLCACVLTSSLVTSSPVFPMQGQRYSPIDACLFMCNICYENSISEMMDCANNVCLAKNGYELVLGLMKLGRFCKGYKTQAAFDFEDNTTN